MYCFYAKILDLSIKKGRGAVARYALRKMDEIRAKKNKKH